MSQPAGGGAAEPPRVDALALTLAPLGSVAVGCIPFVTVELFRAGLDTASVMFWRAAVALTVLAVIALAARTPLTAAWRDGGRAMCAIAFVLGTLQSYCYFRAIEKLPTSVCVLLFFLYPLITVVLQRWVYGLRAPAITVAACALILFGAGLTGGTSLTLADAHPRDLAFALACPLSYSFYSIVVARNARTVPVFSGAVFIQLGAVGGFAILVLIGGLIPPPDLGGWLRVVAIGVLGTAFYTIALAYSLPRLGAIGYGILSSLELVTVVVLGVALRGERLGTVQWLGVGLVLAGILLYRPARGARRS